MKINWKLVLMYFSVFVVFTSLYLLFFHSSLLGSWNVLFYRGLGLMIIATVLVLILFLFLNKIYFKINLESLIAAGLITVSFHLAFLVIFPVTFDRSVTMYLLNTMEQKSPTEICQNGIGKDELENYFINEYVKQNKAIERRVKEQSVLDFIREDGNCISLTDKSKNFLKMSEVVKRLYSIN